MCVCVDGVHKCVQYVCGRVSTCECVCVMWGVSTCECVCVMWGVIEGV